MRRERTEEGTIDKDGERNDCLVQILADNQLTE